MPSIKLHVYRKNFGDNGLISCDYRGEGELGAGKDDQHRTVVERDPATAQEIQGLLLEGPEINQRLDDLSTYLPDYASQIASVLGLEGDGPIGLRVGVWDA